MVYFCVGLPGRFSQWCDTVITHLARHLGDPVTVGVWPTLAEIFGYGHSSSALADVAVTLIRTSATHLVMGVRQPDQTLLSALVEANARFVVALEDPRVAVADLLAETGTTAKTVTRAVANSCPWVMRYASLPGALTMRADRVAADAVDAVLALALHFGIAVNDAEAEKIVADVARLGPTQWPTARSDWVSGTPEIAHKMIDGALAAYGEFFANRGLRQILWTRDLFSLATDSSKPPAEVLDVSGNARILIYGPYIWLPAGSWDARITLGFSEEAGRHDFLVDVYSGSQLGCVILHPRGGGIHTANVIFSLNESSGPGIEVRVSVISENACGHLAFGHVVLTPLAIRQPDPLTDSSGDFTSVLTI